MTIVVTIDGPSGSGKSTLAKLLAEKKGYRYLDSGSIYRAVAYVLDQEDISPVESEELRYFLFTLTVQIGHGRISANGLDVTDRIRLPRISSLASAYSALPSVRQKLLDIQREQASGHDLVAEGRDMGSVVFPQADFKFYLTAESSERAKRRFKELVASGYDCDLQDILKQIIERDRNDSTRKISPLVKPADAIEIDTTGLSVEEVLSLMVKNISSENDQK